MAKKGENVEAPKTGETMQKPSIGRIVIYCDGDDVMAPAMVVAVHSDTMVNLRVFHDQEPMYPCYGESKPRPEHLTSVEHVSKAGEFSDCWDWPERV